MFALKRILCLLVLTQLAAQAPAVGRDWFVRAGAQGGDGSLAKPFADPWQALERCERGDRIHIAEGKYFGKLGCGTWEIPFDEVQLLGGYDTACKERDPWRRRSELLWDKASKNWPKDSRLTSQGKYVVVDGIVFDMKDQNQYVDAECTSRAEAGGETALRFTQPATLRNCLVINPGFHAIDCTPGSTIENNLIVNAIDWGICVKGGSADLAKTPAIIKNNTILFCWDTNKPGGGGYGGAAIALRGAATVTANILAHCDNNAIYMTCPPERVAVTKNVFFKNRFSSLKAELASGQAGIVDKDSLEMLEELGLKAHDGNEIRDPKLPVDAQWKALAGRRDETPAGPRPERKPFEDEKPPPIPNGVAPAWSIDRALDLLTPGDGTVAAGARAVKLDVQLASGGTAGVAEKQYAKSDLLDWSRAPESVNGKPLELLAAIGSVANTIGMPEQYDKNRIAGVFLYDSQGKGERITGFFFKGTSAERVAGEYAGRYHGQGKPETLHVVRGMAYATKSVPKAAFFIEAIERHEAPAGVLGKRPPGRDWFVRAGATGGDGSKEKPFRDPFQPLERCESGDTIHVAEGEYVGKLKGSTWRVDTAHVALLGGYDPSFTERNPWKHPTRLLCPADFKGRRGGFTLEGADDHTGTIVDGFVFDKRLNNQYQEGGALNLLSSDKTEHLWLMRPGCVVRNCVFLNGALGAIRVATGQIVENNIFVNHVTQTVDVIKGHTADPLVIRNPTQLIAWDKRFGSGHGSNGHLLHLGGQVRAVVENNIFAFADNDAIRLDADAKEVTLVGNTFRGNLWSHVQRMTSSTTVNDQNWAQLADLGFKKCDGNELLDPAMSVDEKWFANYVAQRRTDASVRKEATVEKPKPRNPFDDPPAGEGSRVAAAPADGGGSDDRNPFEDPKAKAAGEGGMAPVYDWKLAVALFPRNEACRAGARAADQPVKFDGTQRDEPQHAYVETTWDAARNGDAWEQLAGKRVTLRVAIKSTDNQYLLPDVAQAEFLSFLVGGLEGSDSGLPLRCYVKKGTRHERAVKQAKGYGPGKPEEFHVIKGIARQKRQLVVEVVERAD